MSRVGRRAALAFLLSAMPGLLLAADGQSRAGPAGGPGIAAAQDSAQARRKLLAQSAEQALARLGQAGGFSGDARLRIGMPPALRDAEKLLRRLGAGKETDLFIQTLNETAEALSARAAPLVMAEIRQLGEADLSRGGPGAAPLTGLLQQRRESALREQVTPLAREMTEGRLVDRVYKRVVKQATRFGYLRGEAPRLDAYLAQQTLNGLFVVMAEREQALIAGQIGPRVGPRVAESRHQRSPGATI